jgi:RNA polymerase sigma factor (sigma-70 family)
MTMQGTQTVSDQSIHSTGLTEDWSQDEDPEHRSYKQEFGTKEKGQLDLSKSEFNREWVIEFQENSTDPRSDESDGTFLDSQEFREAVDDPAFRADLKWACKRAFYRFSQSTHSSWEDVQQEVLMRFGRWLQRYRHEATRKTVLTRIATNILIDARRCETAKRRQHDEINFDELKFEVAGETSGTQIEDRIFLHECRTILSDDERRVFDELVDGTSLRQMAALNGISAAAMSKRWARIVTKLQSR